MHVDYTGNGVSVTDGLKTHTQEKLIKIKKHFDHHITRIHITFMVKKHEQIAEGSVMLGGKEINAKSTHADMYHAIDDMVHKLDIQLLKHKDKMTSHRVTTKDHKNHGDNNHDADE